MENFELIQKAEAQRLNMIINANRAGDEEARKRAMASWVNNKGEIVFQNEDVQEESHKEKIDAEIRNLEFELMCAENMDFLPKYFYEKQENLDELRKQLKTTK